MEHDLLNKVFQTEQEIGKRIRSEDEKARAQLEDIRAEVERDLDAISNELKDSYKLAMKEAEARAKEKASLMIQRSHNEAEKLRGMDPESIKELITEHIRKIMP